MSSTNLPPHLERVGRQLTAAAHELTSKPRRSRRRGSRLAAAGTAGLAAIATAAVLAIGAGTSTPAAFAVTRHGGSVTLKINRPTSLAAINRKLAAMGIEKIGKAEWAGKRAMTADDAGSSIPQCDAVPAGWKGQWEQMAGSSSGPGYSISESVPAGTWVLVYCASGHVPANLGGAASGSTGNTASGNTGAG